MHVTNTTLRHVKKLSKANTDTQTQQQVVMGRNDSLQRAVFKSSCARCGKKEITVTTHGGVIPQTVS